MLKFNSLSYLANFKFRLCYQDQHLQSWSVIRQNQIIILTSKQKNYDRNRRRNLIFITNAA
ncbi:hypothetical protein NTHI1209_00047 [Haemophilus influenzae]|uniref:Uncharacterized protein n=1 Tax=Haemophilus influenzae TaxID=727 RepID=A0A158T0I8_HAEIF|nr:hypothetical protein NTHI1209_00047 [Haemophilus influenzae]